MTFELPALLNSYSIGDPKHYQSFGIDIYGSDKSRNVKLLLIFYI